MRHRHTIKGNRFSLDQSIDMPNVAPAGRGRSCISGYVLGAVLLCVYPGRLETSAAQETSRSIQQNGQEAKEVSLPGVRNLFKVSDNLYRSAQPTKAGMKAIEALGVKTVINLRANHDDEDETAGTKLRTVHIPVDTWNIPDDAAINFLKTVSDRSQGPFLVHCMHGADRTGLFVAVYRTVVQDWPKEKARKELIEGPFGFHPLWINIPRYLDSLDVDALRKRLQASLTE